MQKLPSERVRTGYGHCTVDGILFQAFVRLRDLHISLVLLARGIREVKRSSCKGWIKTNNPSLSIYLRMGKRTLEETYAVRERRWTEGQPRVDSYRRVIV